MADLKMAERAEYRRVIKLDPVDEKVAFFGQKGIFFIAGRLGEGTGNALFLSMSFFNTNNPGKPMLLVMNSVGGQTDEGLAIYDSIKSYTRIGVRVDVLCIGLAASMATCVLQAATKRYSYPNTQFMLHEVSQVIVAREKASESRERTAEVERINGIVMGIIADGVGMPREKLMTDTNKKDLWLNATDALSFGRKGLIDDVINKTPIEIITEI